MIRTLNLIGYIGKDITAAQLQEELQGDETELVINLHSPGGSVPEGWAIYNVIEAVAASKQITFQVVGLAASMASFIMMAGSKVLMAENSMLMVHAPRGGVTGTVEQMRSGADMLEKVKGLMKDGYMRASGKDENTVLAWMSKDTWFTPQEALTAGLIDGIIEPVMRGNPTREFLNALTPEMAYSAWIDLGEKPSPESKPQANKQMETVIAYLELDGQAKEKDIIKAIQELEASSNAAVARAEKAENDLQALRTEMADKQAAVLVDAAIDAGKVAKAHRDRYLKLAKADYDTTKEIIDGMEAYTPPSTQVVSEKDEDLVAEWEKRHRQGTLNKLQHSNPERYQALYTAYKESKKG